jgi:hypothetical protein
MDVTRSLQRVLAVLCGSILAVSLAFGQSRTTYSGRAYAAYVNTAVTGPITLSDTGSLPSSGGVLGNSLLSANVPGVLAADVLVASTSGSSGTANSSASLANVTVLPGHAAELRVSFVRSETHATCEGLTGNSEIVGLQFAGQTVTVTGQPNQTVTIPGVATLIINEQTQANNGNHHEITVNAIHLIVNGVAEVILSSAHSDINCAKTPRGPCHDFVTGGGWITTAGGGKGNFGFNVGMKSETKPLTAHLNYVDHGAKMRVKVTSATVYGGSGNTRHFEGTCEVNGVAGFTYVCDVTDNGEPGRGADIFSLSVSNGYSASGVLAGGNIQLHDPCH